ncbi:MAG TPA: chromate transporter [Firmicutes bacterium]|nr:chromate transporter [Candidatus Fermentithermobacillaceae bacterium]
MAAESSTKTSPKTSTETPTRTPGRSAPLLEILWSFFKIGAFTFGGGWAMVPLIRKELVSKKGWLDDSDFVDLLAIAQSGPGPIAINVASLTGHRIRKVPGAIASVVGASLPSFMVILALVSVLSRFRSSQHLEAIFTGMRPAILGLLANALIVVSKSSIKKSRDVVFAVVAAILLIGFRVNPIYVVMMAMVAGIAVGAISRSRSRRERGNASEAEYTDQNENDTSPQSRDEGTCTKNGGNGLEGRNENNCENANKSETENETENEGENDNSSESGDETTKQPESQRGFDDTPLENERSEN